MNLDAKKLASALKLVRNLIERIQSRPTGGAADDEDGPVVVHLGLAGGYRLSGEAAQMHEDCLAALENAQSTKTKPALASRTRAKKLLHTAVVRTLMPRLKRPDETRKTFARRLQKELANIKHAIAAPPKKWTVRVRVTGILSKALPFALGNIDFDEANADKARTLADAIKDADPKRKRRGHPHSVEAENETRQGARSEIVEAFSQDVIAMLTVYAADAEAARDIAIERVRETADIINFFSTFLDEAQRQGRVFVAPDGPRAHEVWAVQDADGEGRLNLWTLPWASDTGDKRIFSFDVGSKAAKECGLARVHEVLRKDERSDLEKRILTGLSWAGRAKVEFRREQAFVLYAIALESLLASSNARVGVISRIPLRLAHLLGRDRGYRKQLHERVAYLFKIRNEIVHSGEANELEEDDLRDMQELANLALTSMLIHGAYVEMKNAREFESWLDEQLL
jgi:hypothetical protein